MPDSVPPTSPKPNVDVRRLSLAQLHALAQRGSRRARQELDARMAAPPSAAAHPPAALRPAAAPPMPQPDARAGLGRALSNAAATDAGGAEDPRIEQLQFLARQDSVADRSRDLPKLAGLLLLIWGALLAFGGLIMLAYSGGSYYLVMGAATLAVGALLLKSRFWAIYLQPLAVLAALGWAWVASHSVAGVLAQAAPIWISACWMAFPQVREPLS